jgi:hypothetical protein
VEHLIAEGADVNETDGYATPLLLAARGLHLEVVELLLDAGADVHATSAPDGDTPLHEAVESEGHAYDHQSEREPRRCRIIEALVNAGADMHAANKPGYTPSGLARSEWGKGQAVRVFDRLDPNGPPETDIWGEPLDHTNERRRTWLKRGIIIAAVVVLAATVLLVVPHLT